MIEKIQRHRWGLTLTIELIYVFLYIGVAKIVKLLNESGYINNAAALVWVILFLFVTFRLIFRVIKGFKQAILEGAYLDQGLVLESYVDNKHKVHFCDFSDEIQEFILNNYSFCMNRMTHEFYLVPLQNIQGKIIRVDNSPNVNDIFEKSLYTYIDCRDSENVKDFCLRNPQVLSFVTVIGDIKPDIMIIKIESIEDIRKLEKLLNENKDRIIEEKDSNNIDIVGVDSDNNDKDVSMKDNK